MQQDFLALANQARQIIDEAPQLPPCLRQQEEQNGDKEPGKQGIHDEERQSVRHVVAQQRIDETLQQICGDDGSKQRGQDGAHGHKNHQCHAEQNDKDDRFFVVKITIEKASQQFSHTLSAFSDPVVVRDIILGKVQDSVPALLNKDVEIALRTRVRGDDFEYLLGLQSIQCQLCFQQRQRTHQSAGIKFLIGLNFHGA